MKAISDVLLQSLFVEIEARHGKEAAEDLRKFYQEISDSYGSDHAPALLEEAEMKKSLIEDYIEARQSKLNPIRGYSGRWLTERRHEAVLTQERLAELVGVSKQTVGSWEQGRSYPTFTHVAKLQEVLDAREQVLRRFLEGRIKRLAAQEGK